MRHARLTGLLLLALVPALASAQRGPQRDVVQREIRPVFTGTLTAHEWGVWLLEDGDVTLNALANESPSFVARGHQAPQTPARPPVVARKPVLYLRASEPIQDLRINVSFTGGQPWLLFPVGQVAGNAINWRGRLQPRPAERLQTAAQGHWWHHLRNVNADYFTSAHGTTERFLFYDGPVSFQSPLRSRTPLRARQASLPLWRVTANGAAELDVTTRSANVRRRGSKEHLRGWLLAALTGRGLEPDEAAALINTWAPELFEGDHARDIYFVSRAAYDRMLPLTIFPRPTELVRVGLVIDRR
ncbi:MAG: hypothetical protein AAGE52_34865 [Myxococcota bacterium]